MVFRQAITLGPASIKTSLDDNEASDAFKDLKSEYSLRIVDLPCDGTCISCSPVTPTEHLSLVPFFRSLIKPIEGMILFDNPNANPPKVVVLLLPG
jgi:hypothetical protein